MLTATLAERELDATQMTEGQAMTLMFSDMEGFTRMTERLGDGGIEQGDGFLLAFSDCRQAVDCAAAIQRAFVAHNDAVDEPIVLRAGRCSRRGSRRSR